jgi:hypothetical protein
MSMHIARGHVGAETAAHLNTAEMLISEIYGSPGRPAEPLVVDVDDDGDRVRLFIG